VNGLYTFNAGNPIVADEVNDNFQYVLDQIEANAVSKSFGGESFAAGGTGAECTLGDVWLTASNIGGGTPARGQLLSINQNTALFSLLGTHTAAMDRQTSRSPIYEVLRLRAPTARL
jgi:hypothetical protein